MEGKIKSYFESLYPKELGLKGKIKVSHVMKLGQGASNLNYFIEANGKKFVLRINADPNVKGKVKKEFNGLKIIQHLEIGPVPRMFSEDKKIFGSDFLIIDYVEGKTPDKINIYLKDSMVRGVARLLAKVHTVKISSEMRRVLSADKRSKEVVAGETISKYLKYIRNHVKDKEFFEMVDISVKKAEELMGASGSDGICLSHGDFCEQNILYDKGRFKLIDFEYIELSDPVSQVAHVVIDFGKPFNKHQRKLFFKEYLRIKKIKDLEKKVDCFIPILYLLVFLWSIEYALKIRNKEFGDKYLKGHDISKDLKYVETMFKRNIRAKVIDKKYSKMNFKKLLNI